MKKYQKSAQTNFRGGFRSRDGDQRGRYQEQKSIKKLYQPEHLFVKVDVLQELRFSNDITHDKDSPFADLEARVNAAKSSMDQYTDPKTCPNYHAIQSNVDLYKKLRFVLMDKYNAQLVTNAWLKYYEIYMQWGINDMFAKLRDNNQPLLFFGNAELPGASVCSLNHICKTAQPAVPLQWYASSLVPANLFKDADNPSLEASSTALNDVYGVWEMNRSNWLMSVPSEVVDSDAYVNNGDATIYDNILDYERKIGPASSVGGVHIYSHDAGIDVSTLDDATGQTLYNRQEELDARIHLGCAIAGFVTLRKGGMFVAKQYTYFLPVTYDLIMIYSTMFEEFYLCKPLTSRPYNSEIYLVGKGFLGFPAKTREVLVDRLKNWNTRPLIEAENEPKDVMNAIRDFADRVFGDEQGQVAFIRENLQFYDTYCHHFGNFKYLLEPVKNERVDAWLKEYPVLAISKEDYLPSKKVRDMKT